MFFSHACSQTMAEERIFKILFDSDSEEEFIRFTNEDIVQLGREMIAVIPWTKLECLSPESGDEYDHSWLPNVKQSLQSTRF